MKELYKNILDSVDKDRDQNIEKQKNSRVLIIDGLNTFIRCWTSTPTLNDDGDHVGGVTGTLKSIGYRNQTNSTDSCYCSHLMVKVVLKCERKFIVNIKQIEQKVN